MTHLEQITKQATEALNAYAAKARVPADQIPALTITEEDGRYLIQTPGPRVATAICEAIKIDGMTASQHVNSRVSVYPAPAPVDEPESLEAYMLRNGFDRNDI